jgi:hypothetical protein
MLGWDRYGFDKKNVMTHYVELVFFHPLRYAGHVVHSGASGSRNINTVYFMLGRDRYELHKKHAGTRYAELVFLLPFRSTVHIAHSGASRP